MTYLFGTVRIELTGTTDRAVNERDLQIHLPFVIELIFVKSVDNFLGYLSELLDSRISVVKIAPQNVLIIR